MINVISSVINNLYEKEGILVLVEDNDEEDKREFTLNINYA